jgi:hypothetical protein
MISVAEQLMCFLWMARANPIYGAVQFSSVPRVEAGSSTSTVALRVVGGDEKGSLESETVKYGHESQGTQTRE